MNFIDKKRMVQKRLHKYKIITFFYFSVFFFYFSSCSPPKPEDPIYVKNYKPGIWQSWMSESKTIDFRHLILPFLCGNGRVSDEQSQIDKNSNSTMLDDSEPDIMLKDNTLKGLLKYPRAGIASHHILVAPVLMAYYRELALENPDITTIFIIGPDHFRKTRAGIAIGTEPFVWGKKRVNINIKAATGLAHDLSIEPDPLPFKLEHTILTHVPFIASFFPDATIVPVIIDQNCPLAVCDKASTFIRDYIADDRGTFILLSIDFSHHVNREETMERDFRSMGILREMDPGYTRNLTCDSPKSWYVLTNVFSHNRSSMEILYYTTNEIWLGREVQDITSYFFTFLRTALQ